MTKVYLVVELDWETQHIILATLDRKVAQHHCELLEAETTAYRAARPSAVRCYEVQDYDLVSSSDS